MNNWTAMWMVMAVSVVVVLYLVWKLQHDHAHWQRKCEQEDLVRTIHRELGCHQADLLSRCAELDRKLTHHHRTLRYIARRVS